MKNISAYILGIVALFATMACSKEKAEDTIVTIDREVKVYLPNPQDITTGPGWIYNLRCYTNDTCKLQYKSNDENVVAVNEDGYCEGVNPGKTTIDVSTINGAPVQSFNVEVPPLGVSTFDEKKNIIETKEIKSAARFNGSFTRSFTKTSEIILLSTEENKDWSSITDIEKYHPNNDKEEYMIYRCFVENDEREYCFFNYEYQLLNDKTTKKIIQNNNGIYTIFLLGENSLEGPAIFYRGEIKQLN